MLQANSLGANIPRADERTIQRLMDMGLIYVGDDNQLHVKEHKKSTTNNADQS